jgi:hypothetical protein
MSMIICADPAPEHVSIQAPANYSCIDGTTEQMAVLHMAFFG